MVRQLPKERLLIRSASTQSDEADSVMDEIDLAAHQPMQPMLIHEIGVSEHMNAAVFVAAADEDNGAVQRAVEVKLEPFWKRAARRRAVSACSGFTAVSVNITRRNALQARDAGAMVALPDLALPKGVEALNSVLEPRLAWRGKYRNDLQCQTPATDATHGVGVVVRSLEDRVVVELGVCRQSFGSPAPQQCFEGALRAGLWHHPGVGERAMQTGAGKHRNERAVSDLQVLDKVERVELGLSQRNVREIPSFRWRRPKLAAHSIERAATRQHSVDGGPRRNLRNPRILAQCQPDRIRAKLTQHTLFPQAASHAYNPLFKLDCRTVPGSARLAICERDPVDAPAASTLNPRKDSTHAHPKRGRDIAQTAPCSHCLDHPATPFFKGKFLTMAHLAKIQIPYTNCSGNAETRLFT